MIHLVHTNGNVEHYTDYEILNKNTLALYDTNSINEHSYIVTTPDVDDTLKNGDDTKTLPALYDSSKHGPLTNTSFSQFRASTFILAVSDNTTDIKTIANNIKTANITIKPKE